MTPFATNRLRVEELSEEAFKSFFQSHPDLLDLEITSVQSEDEEEVLKRLHVRAESQGEHAPGLGVHRIRVRIGLEIDGTQVSEEETNTLWAAINGYLYWEALSSELTSRASGLGIYGLLRVNSPTGKTSGEDRWIRSAVIDVMAYETE